MDTRSFLSRVLPPTGSYVLTVQKGVGKDAPWWNYGSYDTIDELVAAADAANADKSLSVFFAVVSHRNNVQMLEGKTKISRTQATAYEAKTLCFDLDVGSDRPYQTAKDGMRAFEIAREEIGLPSPMVVRSGRGLHIYWPLVETLTKDRWARVSIALREALAKHGLVIDTSKIHDASMVLRPVGCHHKKDPANWKPVQVIQDCPDHSIVDLFRILKPFDRPAVAKPSAGKKKTSAILSAVLDNDNLPPVNLDDVIEGCAQVRALVESGGTFDFAGNKVEEPLWRDSMGFIASCAPEDIPTAIVRIAGKHEKFALEDNLAKMDLWKGSGPTLCATFEKHCASGCAGCPHKGKIKSPASLTKGEQVAVVEHAAGEQEEVHMPETYFVKGGAIWREFKNVKKIKDDDGKTQEVEFMDMELVCPYIIWVVARYRNIEDGTTVVVIRAKFPTGSIGEFELPAATLSAGGAELSRAFGDMQVILKTDAQLRATRIFLMTYLQEIQAALDSERVYTAMGWQEDGSFLLGNTLISADKEEVVKTAGPAKNYENHLNPVGGRQTWIDTVQMYGYPELHLHGFFFLCGVGSLVMEGSTVSSAMVNLYSPESGAGKSLTQLAVNSIWGDPSKLMLSVSDTENALYKTFGVLHSMSPCVDEITKVNPDVLGGMLYRISEGIEKLRMDKNAHLRPRTTWKTIVVGSSNKDLYRFVDLSVGSEAQKLRLFQAYIPKSQFLSANGKRIVTTLMDNYGHAAPEIVRYIIAQGGPAKVYDDAQKRLQAKNLVFRGEERFIEAIFVAAEAGGFVLKELGMLSYDYEVNLLAGFSQIDQVRDDIESGALDGFDAIGQFLTEHNANLVVYRENKSTPTSRGAVQLPAPDMAVARLEVAHTTNDPLVSGRVCINNPALKKWCTRQGVDYTKILMDLSSQGALVSKNERVSLYRDCGRSNPGQAYCLIIDAVHPRIRSVLTDNRTQTIAASPRMALLQSGHA
jgi:hypothetical protein